MAKANKYFPMKGDIVDKAIQLVRGIAEGKLVQYPEVSLKLAGTMVVASRYGHPEVKKVLHDLITKIRAVANQYKLKGKRQVINAEIPPRALAEIQSYARQALRELESIKGMKTVEVLEVVAE